MMPFVIFWMMVWANLHTARCIRGSVFSVCTETPIHTYETTTISYRVEQTQYIDACIVHTCVTQHKVYRFITNQIMTSVSWWVIYTPVVDAWRVRWVSERCYTLTHPHLHTQCVQATLMQLDMMLDLSHSLLHHRWSHASGFLLFVLTFLVKTQANKQTRTTV